MQIFDDEPVFDRIATIARIHAERLTQLREFSIVGETRQIGSTGALELRAEDAGYLSAMRPKLYHCGVLLRPLGNVVYVLPPYVIEPEELHRAYDVIVEAVEALFKEWRFGCMVEVSSNGAHHAAPLQGKAQGRSVWPQA